MELSTWPQVSHLPETPGRFSQFSRAMDPRAAHACCRDGKLVAPRKVGNSLQSRNCCVHGRVSWHMQQVCVGGQIALERDLQKHRDVLGRGFPSLCLGDP